MIDRRPYRVSHIHMIQVSNLLGYFLVRLAPTATPYTTTDVKLAAVQYSAVDDALLRYYS